MICTQLNGFDNSYLILKFSNRSISLILPLQIGVHLWVMAMKGYSHSLSFQNWSLITRCNLMLFVKPFFLFFFFFFAGCLVLPQLMQSAYSSSHRCKKNLINKQYTQKNGKPIKFPMYDTKLHLMVRLFFWRSRKCEVSNSLLLLSDQLCSKLVVHFRI